MPSTETSVTIFDAMCECGRHTQSLDEPVCCQRCGSNRITVQRKPYFIVLDVGHESDRDSLFFPPTPQPKETHDH